VLEIQRQEIHEATWLGQAGRLTEYQLESDPLGLRVAVRQWQEDGEHGRRGDAEVRLIRGDGRSEGFEELSKVLLAGPTEDETQIAIDGARELAESLA
jgi:hypothetical protein